MKKHLNIVVKGKVQGVFFRANTEKKANELGIKGFVKNRANGTVYIEAEGEENILNSFTEWCKKGPPGATVTELSIEEEDFKNFRDFLLLRN